MLHIDKMLSLPQLSSCFNSFFSALPTGQQTGCINKESWMWWVGWVQKILRLCQESTSNFSVR